MIESSQTNEIIQVSSQLDTHQSKLLNELLSTLNQNQKIWLGGYLSGINESTKLLLTLLSGDKNIVSTYKTLENDQKTGLKILYGTRSGNSLKIAKSIFNNLHSNGLHSEIINLNDYDPKSLKKEKNLLIIVSTDGEGDPPLSAEEFYNFLLSNKAPMLENLQYSVLALGDSKYQNFCKTGKDIDNRLSELRAKRITDRIDCDVDFEATANQWIEKTVSTFLAVNKIQIPAPVNRISISPAIPKYSKQNPFPAKIIDKTLLNGRKSSKETYHLEFSLENSGLTYEPGDALGIINQNSPELVDKILDLLKLTNIDSVNLTVNTKSLRELLLTEYELSTITPPVVEDYAKICNNSKLVKIVSDKDKLQHYLYGRDILDLIEEFPYEMDKQTFLFILRKLQPRLYSIASSAEAYPDEVHITVGIVRYLQNNRMHQGFCSSYLADKVDEKTEVSLYIDENISFRLPTDTNQPIIMIGAGTGIAPYRAFIQHRKQQKAAGKSWLFFGDRNFNTDFLYQSEWIKHLKDKTLTKIDVAFSRDQKEKIYIQHKLLEKKKLLFEWIKEGAHLYICGDKNTMGRDVKETLLSIIKSESGYSEEKSAEYFKQLRKENRYHEDVY